MCVESESEKKICLTNETFFNLILFQRFNQQSITALCTVAGLCCNKCVSLINNNLSNESATFFNHWPKLNLTVLDLSKPYSTNKTSFWCFQGAKGGGCNELYALF